MEGPESCLGVHPARRFSAGSFVSREPPTGRGAHGKVPQCPDVDFADATLVALGEELDTDRVFILDRRGFSTYRMNRRKPFRVIP
jgi:hypothetical protein